MADQKVQLLLENWGLEDYTENFRDQKIDSESLLYLDHNTIRDLIPEAGPRLKFSAKLLSYVEFNGESSASSNAKRLHPAPETLARDTFIMNKTDIVELLRHKCPKILNKLEKNEVIFIGEKREINRHLVLQFTNNYGAYPIAEEKIQLAQLIVESFPILKSEEGVPYVQWYCPATKCKRACGLIEDRLINWRKGLCPGDKDALRTRNVRLVDESAQTVTKYIPPDSITEEDFIGLKLWLKEHSFPENIVIEYMGATLPRRRKEFQESENLGKLMLEWPKLLEAKYIDLEFHTVFRNCENTFTDGFLKSYKKIIVCAKNHSNKELKELLTNIDIEVTEQSHCLNLAVQVLPYLLPPGVIKVKRDEKIMKLRPSIVSACGYFYELLPIGVDIPTYIDGILRSNKKQPFIIAVGNRAFPIQCGVIIEGHYVPTDSLIHAVDTCFKLMYLHDISFDPHCQNIWNFINKMFFKIPPIITSACITELTLALQ